MELFLIIGGLWLLSAVYQYNKKAQRDYIDSKNVEMHDTIINEVREIISEEVRKILEEQRSR